jgi:hypothetical protein
MNRVMQYCLGTKQKGLTLKPDCKWDGDPNFKFILAGKSDSTYASDENAKSVTGYSTTLNGAVISYKSKGQTAMTLSVTESELVAAIDCVQDLLFERRVLESIGLQVELPMILRVDNRGVVDLVNNWSVTGRTRHITARINFLRELKEQGIIKVEWIATGENSADLFTKNLQGPLFERHANVYVSDMLSTNSQREGVEERILSHEQLGTESSVTEPEQNLKSGTGPDVAQGLGGNAGEYNESSENNREGQDLNQDQERKSNEQWDSGKKSQEQCDWDD